MPEIPSLIDSVTDSEGLFFDESTIWFDGLSVIQFETEDLLLDFVDELEWFSENGCYLFVINDSDLNGDPEQVMAICDEIIRRNLKTEIYNSFV